MSDAFASGAAEWKVATTDKGEESYPPLLVQACRWENDLADLGSLSRRHIKS